MKSFSRKVKFAGLALFAASGMAVAAVSFDSSTGTGFVGKGDIQSAFTLNNNQIQAILTSCSTLANANCNLDFNYASVDTYSATCTFTTGDGTPGEKVQNVDIPRHTGVNGAVGYDSRQRSQVTGFNLTGFGETTSSGTPPVVGALCVGGGGAGQDGVWTAVTLVSSTGGLEACLSATTTTTTGKGKNQISVTTVTMVCKPMPNTPVL
jgi:hypothetical protein